MQAKAKIFELLDKFQGTIESCQEDKQVETLTEYFIDMLHKLVFPTSILNREVDCPQDSRDVDFIGLIEKLGAKFYNLNCRKQFELRSLRTQLEAK